MKLLLLEAVQRYSIDNIDVLIQNLIDASVSAGKRVLAAVLIYIIGRYIVKLITKIVRGMLDRRPIEVGVKSFLMSLLNILLTVLLIISVIGALGVNTTSFAALLASAGVAVGMALSGNLQNFAGGIIILLFRPYRVGDWIEAQGVQGTVREIQIFHTIIATADNKLVYAPNGSMSTSVVVNYSREELRRVQWTVGIDYGEDVKRVRAVLLDYLNSLEQILKEPADKAPFVGVDALADSSVNLTVRAWVKTEDYWTTYFDVQQGIYELFNREGINIPVPQQTVHLAKD